MRKPVMGGPYMPTRPQKPAQPQSNVVGPQAVRATGQGPYDNAYRQDLATYAGGLFQRPNGVLSLNPTGQLSGNATGGGNAPVQGMPNTLLSQALGGQGFSFAPPQPTPSQTTNTNSIQPQSWQEWIQNMMGGNQFGRQMP